MFDLEVVEWNSAAVPHSAPQRPAVKESLEGLPSTFSNQLSCSFPLSDSCPPELRRPHCDRALVGPRIIADGAYAASSTSGVTPVTVDRPLFISQSCLRLDGHPNDEEDGRKHASDAEGCVAHYIPPRPSQLTAASFQKPTTPGMLGCGLEIPLSSDAPSVRGSQSPQRAGAECSNNLDPAPGWAPRSLTGELHAGSEDIGTLAPLSCGRHPAPAGLPDVGESHCTYCPTASSTVWKASRVVCSSSYSSVTTSAGGADWGSSSVVDLSSTESSGFTAREVCVPNDRTQTWRVETFSPAPLVLVALAVLFLGFLLLQPESLFAALPISYSDANTASRLLQGPKKELEAGNLAFETSEMRNIRTLLEDSLPRYCPLIDMDFTPNSAWLAPHTESAAVRKIKGERVQILAREEPVIRAALKTENQEPEDCESCMVHPHETDCPAASENEENHGFAFTEKRTVEIYDALGRNYSSSAARSSPVLLHTFGTERQPTAAGLVTAFASVAAVVIFVMTQEDGCA